MFRKSSILPPRLEEIDVQQEHPYTFENEEEVIEQMSKEAEEREKQNTEKHAALLLMELIAQKDKELISQAEEIGRLKERIAQLEREKNSV